MVECLEALQQPLMHYPFVLAVVGRLNNEHFSNYGVKMSFLKFYSKICCIHDNGFKIQPLIM